MDADRAGEANVKSKAAKFKRYLPLYLMFLPGAVYLLINNYIPMAGLVVAFKQYNVRKGLFGSPWIGFSNFKFLFSTPDAMVITRNTILYNAAFILINTARTVISLYAMTVFHLMRKSIKAPSCFRI
jgi:putative aldouronate transport system permease protein